MEDSPLMTQEAAAAYLTVTTKTLKNWRRDKKGPRTVSIGNRVRYIKAELDAYIKMRMELSNQREMAGRPAGVA
jgi:predicted DNA-binding transcriptional regulator AlpA